LSVRNLATIRELGGVGGQQRVISANAAVEEARWLIEDALAEQGTRPSGSTASAREAAMIVERAQGQAPPQADQGGARDRSRAHPLENMSISRAETLIRQQRRVMAACDELLLALGEASPSDRDYLQDDALAAALQCSADWIGKIYTLKQEGRGAHARNHGGCRAMTRDERLKLAVAATSVHGHEWTYRGGPGADKFERAHAMTAFRGDDFRPEFIALCCGIGLLAKICGGFAAVTYFLIG
jgi:hypothetical protein